MTTYIPSPNVAVTRHSGDPASAAGSHATRVAAFSCRGLENLSESLGFAVAVVAAVRDPDRHLRHLGDTCYASGSPMSYDEWPTPFDFDDFLYREWWKVRMDERWFGRNAHPLSDCVEDGCLLVRLPTGVSAGSFAASFRDGLSDLRFETVARRPSHCVRRHNSRRQVAVTSRYARASASDPVAVEVRDLISFHSRTLPRIADIALATLVRVIASVDAV